MLKAVGQRPDGGSVPLQTCPPGTASIGMKVWALDHDEAGDIGTIHWRTNRF